MAWGSSRARRCSSRGPVGRIVIPTLLSMAALLLLATTAEAGLGDYRCTDTGRVYHGNARLIRKPAVCSADRVYRHIPEYRQILSEHLTEKDVRYHFLMKEASQKFLKAVKAMAREGGFDFVAEVGAVQVVREGAKQPVDKTDAVIAKLG